MVTYVMYLVTFAMSQVRDIVEGALKPGDSTLQVLGTLTPIIRSLGPGGADPVRLKTLPIAAAAVWALYVGELRILVINFYSVFCANNSWRRCIFAAALLRAYPW